MSDAQSTAAAADIRDPTTLAALAHRLGDAARAETLSRFRTAAAGADNKAGPGAFDPVTAADRAAERAIRTLLAAERPADAILGEEEAAAAGTSGLTWVIDPIDGTRAFISGLPTWGTLIALDDGTRGILGLVDHPVTDERFLGLPGHGAWTTWRGETGPAAVRATRRLAEATLMTTDPGLFQGAEAAAFAALRAQCRLTRYGADCYAYAMLAIGQIDLVVESRLQAYDIAAPAALIQAAGGTVTDWRGRDCRWGGQVVAAATPELAAEARAHLAPVAAATSPAGA
ncbi:MAG: histidinol-phosphatase [Pseudomonadota bacterium]